MNTAIYIQASKIALKSFTCIEKKSNYHKSLFLVNFKQMFIGKRCKERAEDFVKSQRLIKKVP